MPSHYSSIGFDGLARKGNGILQEILSRGVVYPINHLAYIKYRDPSGAEIWVQLDEYRKIIGVNPHFVGKAATRIGIMDQVRPRGSSQLDGSFYGYADPPAGEPEMGCYYLLYDSPNFLINEFNFPRNTNIQLAAFAHSLSVHPDQAAYYQSQGRGKTASQAFFPAKLFTRRGDVLKSPKAEAYVVGEVLESSKLVNELTNQSFYWARIQSFLAELDVVFDPVLFTGDLVAGNVIEGSFWLSGKTGTGG